MIIEGKNVVLQAIKANQTINALFVQNGQNDAESKNIISLARQNNIKINFSDKFVLDKKSQTKHHQGFLAEVVDFEYCDVEDILEVHKKNQTDAFIVILDGIKDPHNFGAIIRTCECCGVDGIIISKHRCVAVNDTVVKTSTGACANMKIARVTNINNTFEMLKKQNIWVFGAELGGENIYQTNLKGNVAIVLGSEGEGLSRLTKEKCDQITTIPLFGTVNSLNASVACGVVLFEAKRQRV